MREEVAQLSLQCGESSEHDPLGTQRAGALNVQVVDGGRVARVALVRRLVYSICEVGPLELTSWSGTSHVLRNKTVEY